MLTITIEKITAHTYIGVYDWEQEQKQTVYITVQLRLNSDQSTRSDILSDTVDYDRIQTSIIDHVSSRRFALIEKMAGDIHALMLTHTAVSEATITIEKPGALKHSAGVSVTHSI